VIRLELPWLPPSSNHAYVNMRGRGRILSKPGRAFLVETKAHFAQNYPAQLRFFERNQPYYMFFRFIFEDLENKGFATGKAASRYKVFDGGNRTKLLEDALKDVGGIDDSQTLVSLWEKRQGTPERTVLWAWRPGTESTPFDELLQQLR
jgi:Endodeoxyribonuclease RusA